MTPQAISQWGDRETKNTQYRYANSEDMRGDTAGATPGWPFASVGTISFTTMMKRE
jgi:hypothetical protein